MSESSVVGRKPAGVCSLCGGEVIARECSEDDPRPVLVCKACGAVAKESQPERVIKMQRPVYRI